MIPIDIADPLTGEKNCDVTVEGRTISVRAGTLYDAALAYAAQQKCRPAGALPVLKDDTVIEIQVEDEDGARTVCWEDVMRRSIPSPGTDDPNDSDLLRDELKGQTLQHARPARLEDEGQSGG